MLDRHGLEANGRASTLLERLLEKGIVRDYLEIRRPDLTPDADLYERFATEISWLAGLGGSFEAGHRAFSRLRQARVVVIGLGGAGSILTQMLAAAGVGELILVDGDTVEDSNLSRQIFYSSESARRSEAKTIVLERSIRALTTFTSVVAHNEFVANQQRIEEIVKGSDAIALTADTPRIKLQRSVNGAAIKHGVPLIYSFVGQVGPFFIPGKSACFGCLEHHWRRKSGEAHDLIVEGYSNIGRREQPATVLAAARIANGLCSEILGHLTQLIPVETIDQMVHYVGNHGSSYERCLRDKHCACSIWRGTPRRP
ncbi:MAG: ThiF family adenylyltransferase [Burkholderiales bacterium]|nr:ThiF family adenylyltransferase [Burkholderiales bacterium]